MRTRKTAKRCSGPPLEPRTDNVRRREIDAIPVVDEGRVPQVQPVNGLLLGGRSAPERVNEDQQRQEPLFVDTRAQETRDL